MSDFYIQFQTGDVPGINPGYRGVQVRQLGRKWVHCILTATGKKFKIKKVKWESLPKTSAHSHN